MSPTRTLANTKLPPKTDSESTPTNSYVQFMRTLVDGFRKIVHHRRWIQRLGIVLALLLIVLAFLARHCTATERSENATSYYHAYRKYTECP